MRGWRERGREWPTKTLQYQDNNTPEAILVMKAILVLFLSAASSAGSVLVRDLRGVGDLFAAAQLLRATFAPSSNPMSSTAIVAEHVILLITYLCSAGWRPNHCRLEVIVHAPRARVVAAEGVRPQARPRGRKRRLVFRLLLLHIVVLILHTAFF